MQKSLVHLDLPLGVRGVALKKEAKFHTLRLSRGCEITYREAYVTSWVLLFQFHPLVWAPSSDTHSSMLGSVWMKPHDGCAFLPPAAPPVPVPTSLAVSTSLELGRGVGLKICWKCSFSIQPHTAGVIVCRVTPFYFATSLFCCHFIHLYSVSVRIHMGGFFCPHLDDMLIFGCFLLRSYRHIHGGAGWTGKRNAIQCNRKPRWMHRYLSLLL